ncbi:MAG: hypothetical protein JXR91_03085 [Deltaproteobacteria bacterium]|nr:hypothetical protein [Deltaproteobacteria bacterium]
MKYFVPDPTADMGIRQLGEQNVKIDKNSTLQYSIDGGKTKINVPKDKWFTDWDKTIYAAYSTLNEKIREHTEAISKLKIEKARLVDASPKLQRMENQMKLF